MTNKAAMTQRQRADRERRARYAESNALARKLCGLPPSKQFPVVSEADWIASDLANSRDKPAQHKAHALKLQIKNSPESWL